MFIGYRLVFGYRERSRLGSGHYHGWRLLSLLGRESETSKLLEHNICCRMSTFVPCFPCHEETHEEIETDPRTEVAPLGDPGARQSRAEGERSQVRTNVRLQPNVSFQSRARSL